MISSTHLNFTRYRVHTPPGSQKSSSEPGGSSFWGDEMQDLDELSIRKGCPTDAPNFRERSFVRSCVNCRFRSTQSISTTGWCTRFVHQDYPEALPPIQAGSALTLSLYLEWICDAWEAEVKISSPSSQSEESSQVSEPQPD